MTSFCMFSVGGEEAVLLVVLPVLQPGGAGRGVRPTPAQTVPRLRHRLAHTARQVAEKRQAVYRFLSLLYRVNIFVNFLLSSRKLFLRQEETKDGVLQENFKSCTFNYCSDSYCTLTPLSFPLPRPPPLPLLPSTEFSEH